MEKKELDKKITEASKSVLSYCMSRTSNRQDAEDLAQDILLEILRSAPSLRNDEAFYGFMWSVAGNVYKHWLRKNSRGQSVELNEIDAVEEFDFDALDKESDVFLLRRELTLLDEKHRKATILYYIENKSCSEISEVLSVSESMVKYLLFKSRKILKEGMNMERNYGVQSYNPKGLSVQFLGNGKNRYWRLAQRIAPQNILFACYNDKLTAEQISLEIGVSLPYIEEDIQILAEHELLLKDGNKYYTNILIFTNELVAEIDRKTNGLRTVIAEKVKAAVTESEEKIRAIGFGGADMSKSAFEWQMTCVLLYDAIVEKLESKLEIEMPVDKFGDKCFVWGVETGDASLFNYDYTFGISTVIGSKGGYIRFMDFMNISGDTVHAYFDNANANVFLEIAGEETGVFSDNDRVLVAEMVKRGYVLNKDGKFSVNAPVFTEKQHNELMQILGNASDEIVNYAEKLLKDVEKIIKNHIPVHLKKLAGGMAYIRMFEDAVAAPVGMLCKEGFLAKHDNADILPTTYAVLK